MFNFSAPVGNVHKWRPTIFDDFRPSPPLYLLTMFEPTLKHDVINGCSLFITEEDIQKLMTMLKLLLPKETLLDRQEYYHAVI